MTWKPSKSVRLFGDLERRVDEAFAQLIHGPWGGIPGTPGWEPAIDLFERTDQYVVLMDLPGVMPEDVHVYVDDHSLVVHGKRASHQFAQAGAVTYSERFQGEFVRRLPLPSGVDSGGMQVRFAQGLLIVQLPKLRRETRQAAPDQSAKT